MTDKNTAPAWAEKTVTLSYPIKHGDETITEITMREPNAGQLEELEALGLPEDEADASSMKMSDLRKTVAILSGVDDEALKGLNVRDLMALGEATGPLLEAVMADTAKKDGDPK